MARRPVNTMFKGIIQMMGSKEEGLCYFLFFDKSIKFKKRFVFTDKQFKDVVKVGHVKTINQQNETKRLKLIKNLNFVLRELKNY